VLSQHDKTIACNRQGESLLQGNLISQHGVPKFLFWPLGWAVPWLSSSLRRKSSMPMLKSHHLSQSKYEPICIGLHGRAFYELIAMEAQDGCALALCYDTILGDYNASAHPQDVNV
jgi:hypothetical protein